MRTMDQLKLLEKAQVHAVHAPRELKRRLMEIGFIPGSTVEHLHRTPFNGPLVFACRGTSIALRASDARCIQLKTPAEH